MAATPSPNLNDQQLLAADPTFQARVKEALAATCISIGSEAITGDSGTMPLQLHIYRARLAATILNNIASGTGNPNAITFAICVATDSATINAATANGATPLTTGNAAAQAVQVPDSDIANALAAQFNSFLSLV